MKVEHKPTRSSIDRGGERRFDGLDVHPVEQVGRVKYETSEIVALFGSEYHELPQVLGRESRLGRIVLLRNPEHWYLNRLSHLMLTNEKSL
jgi:hypothetical protein